MSDDMLTSAEVAARFRVHRATVNRWVGAGLLRFEYAPNRRRLYPASRVEALLAQAVTR